MIEDENRQVVRIWKDEEVFEVNNEKMSNKIKSMKYHQPRGEGDAHYVDCYYEDGCVLRIFRPDTVMFGKRIECPAIGELPNNYEDPILKKLEENRDKSREVHRGHSVKD